MNRPSLLRRDASPLRLVPAARRDVWFKAQPTYRCSECGSHHAALEETTGDADVGRWRYRCVNRKQCARRQR